MVPKWSILITEFYFHQIHELSDLVSGKIISRKSSKDITLLESQGIAISDIATAALAYERAKAEGLGQEIPLEL